MEQSKVELNIRVQVLATTATTNNNNKQQQQRGWQWALARISMSNRTFA